MMTKLTIAAALSTALLAGVAVQTYAQGNIETDRDLVVRRHVQEGRPGGRLAQRPQGHLREDHRRPPELNHARRFRSSNRGRRSLPPEDLP